MRELREEEMTSKEALEELEDSFENDVSYVERRILKVIAKDLEVLEILKKSIFNHEIHKYALDLRRKGQKFMIIAGCVRGDDDITKVKEWLENE